LQDVCDARLRAHASCEQGCSLGRATALRGELRVRADRRTGAATRCLNNFEDALKVLCSTPGNTGATSTNPYRESTMTTRFHILPALLAALLAHGVAQAQTTIDQAKALAGTATGFDQPGFPVQINTPGSYKLTSNLTVPANAPGIEIRANNVHLDLNGFTISGPVTCDWAGNGSGVQCSQAAQPNDVVYGIQVLGWGGSIRNGSIRGFAGDGVRLNSGAVLEDLQIESNVGDAILAGFGTGARPSRISRVQLWHNLGHGIHSRAALIEGAVVWHNHGNGIHGLGATSVVNGLVYRNKGFGIKGPGLAHLSPLTVRGTTVFNNVMDPVSDITSLGGNFNGFSVF
jgi:hypothetical protein